MASKKTKIFIAIIIAAIIVIAGVSIVLLDHKSTVFTDTAQTAAPGSLDPASGFFTTNGPLFGAMFNTLTEFNGSSTTQVVPVLASSITNVSDQNYTFNLRSYANFSNGEPLNASSVWFSFYRGIVMAQGPYVADYPNILFNNTNYANVSIAIPWGLRSALVNAGYTLSGNLSNQYKQAATDLDSILSNFNYNSTELKVMEYPDQAVVVKSTHVVEINTMKPYSYLLQDVAGWWGDILYPAFIDQHGGVVYNTQNSYVNLHGAIGSGPYMLESASSGLGTIVLKANPNYWVDGHTSQVPSIAQPAHIKKVAIKYGLSHSDRLEDFDKNTSQISEVGATSFKSIINGFYDKSEANGNLVKSTAVLGTFYISMNVQRSYTNNTHFREALYDALNYSAELKPYDNNYNGTAMAYTELGPLSPQYGKAYYNPDNFPLPTQNLTAAVQNLTAAGDEMHFYVKLPGGTKIGNTSGTDLSTHDFVITGTSPPTSLEDSQVAVAIASFGDIGLKFTSKYVTEAVVGTWDNASVTPHFVDLGWEPDFSDPIGQQLEAVYDITDGGIGNKAWVDNNTLQKIFNNLDFLNVTDQTKEMKNVSRIVYDQYAYMWLPMPDAYYFVQPYVHNFQYNSFMGYFYNLMYISYSGNTATVLHADSAYTGYMAAMDTIAFRLNNIIR